ncbi:hypothetical protein QO001_005054 [Methylobacterium brachiatum]|jgi:hypothetical protein|uniref:GAPS4 PD-(D/E)XK nuclease domain-containing protein n=1 Tax=Methylobacterium brachiatum TaxID=269660 RepID=A0AAJ1WZ87_9HYPH|nr:hypothetical protein [Methylobacterium brachiatum]MCB4805150.1 hypothetical protein [Methylobacterium brachiatum]MDQ0546105.1 hypothetical protein [Methylobacterium brachiatum]
MAETVHIAAMATKISNQIFSMFMWQKRGPTDHNWDCVKKGEHGKETHPTDVVFFYDEPYRDVRTYVQTDLKSYKTGSIVRSKLEAAIRSLAEQISCAEVSAEYQKDYTHAHRTSEIVGMLFVYNHDVGYDRDFSDELKRLKLDGLDIPRNRRIFVLGPMEIRWLHNVSHDMQWLRGSSEDDKLPSAEHCTYFYPQGDRGIQVLGSKKCAAILEVLTGPWIIIRYRNEEMRQNGYIIYYRDDEASVDDFLYFIDYMRRYGMLADHDKIRIRYIENGSATSSTFQSAQQQYAELVAKSLTDPDSLAAAVRRIVIEPVNSIAVKFVDEQIGMEYAR